MHHLSGRGCGGPSLYERGLGFYRNEWANEAARAERAARRRKAAELKPGFFIKTFVLPAGGGPGLVPCGLHGPVMGDEPVPEGEVTREPRGDRPYPSRLCSRAAKMVNLVTVICGPHGDAPCVLYTAFGGPLAPREPGDPALRDDERAASEAFWAEHALSR